MACGVKTYNAAIGVDVHRRVVPNVWERAESLGRSTGVVTSVPWSHATPAGFVAHCLSRGSYERIAMDMLLRSRADVVMGCGHPGFDNSGKSVAGPDATAYRYVGGRALWEAVAAGTAGGDADGDGVADAWKLIGTKAEFLALATGETPRRVLGVAEAHDTLQQGRAGDGNAEPFAVPMNPNVPTLAEMALAALNVLDEDPDGFCLMIEGGAVDWAGHSNQSGRVIEEEIDFTHAVEAVVAWVEAHSNWQETLLIVTGDHETGYLTGPPGAARHAPVAGRGRGQLPVMEWHSTGHTNLLIPLYAKGDAAAQFAPLADETDPLRGAYVDNTEIAQVVRQALE
jgi:alkaline phosphatase